MDRAVKGYTIKGMAAGSEAGPDALRAVNALALEPLDPAEVYVRSVRLCNDTYDRDYERLPLAYLNRFAETLPGKGFLACHGGSKLPEILGRFYEASVCSEAGVNWLDCSFYMRKTPANQEVRDQIDAGVYSWASIGFLYGDLLCDLCQMSYWGWDCPHWAGEQTGKGELVTCTYGGRLDQVEAIEGSLVYLGAQYGAAVSKAASARETKEQKRKGLDRRFVSGADVMAAQFELHRLAMECCF